MESQPCIDLSCTIRSLVEFEKSSPHAESNDTNQQQDLGEKLSPHSLRALIRCSKCAIVSRILFPLVTLSSIQSTARMRRTADHPAAPPLGSGSYLKSHNLSFGLAHKGSSFDALTDIASSLVELAIFDGVAVRRIPMRVDNDLLESSSRRIGTDYAGTAGSMATLLARTPFVSVCSLASLMLFTASLTQDCFFIDRADNPRAWSSGFGLLAVGWLGVLVGVYSWLANPTLLIAWLAMWSPNYKRYSIGASAIALLLALSFLLHESLMTDEAGNRSRVTGYGIGYWLWIGSMALALVGSCSWLGSYSNDKSDLTYSPHMAKTL